MPEELDAVVIGLGPGGEDVAGRLGAAGWDVVGIDKRLVGGECPYFACIPTKMMVRGAGVLAEASRAPELAGSVDVHPDWNPVADRIRNEATTEWDDTEAVRRLENTGARFVRGTGRISAAGEVTVSPPRPGSAENTGTDHQQHVLRPRHAIVLNPGTDPAVPPIDGLAETPYWTNREAVATREVPESLLVLGGGPVGLEFAQVFRRFGSEVTIVEAAPRPLPHDEPEASNVIEQVLKTEGIQVHTGTHVQRISHSPAEISQDAGEFRTELSSGRTIRTTRLLVATGRRTDLARLSVGAIGIDEHASSIPVDEHLRAADGVWAIGDATGHGAFTHTSVYQARIATADILGDSDETADYRAVPAVTFTDPEVAQVGSTEARAREHGLAARTAVTSLPASPRGWIHKSGNTGLVKLVADPRRGLLIGATAVGPVGGEVLGTLAVAVHGEIGLDTLRRMIFAYPTFHRAIEAALHDLQP